MNAVKILRRAKMILPASLFALSCSMTGVALGQPNNEAIPTNLWKDSTAETLGVTDYLTNRVNIADLNGDGLPDLLFAVGGTNREPLEPTLSRVFFNQGPGKKFVDVSESVFGAARWISRVIKARDVSGDGHVDIVVGTAFGDQSRLYLGDGRGKFTDATATHLPQLDRSVSDIEFGDVDGDGDIDLLLSDWGVGNPYENEGGFTMLWLGDGTGHFIDASEDRLPNIRAQFAWECELVDVDNDYDLDILVTTRFNDSSLLYVNDGHGNFTDVSKEKMPQFKNNYDFEAIDLNGDGWLDTITINDGEEFEGFGLPHRQHVFFNDGRGGFVDVSPTHWPDSENPAYDDNVGVYVDYDSDGDADALIASLTGPDRLLVNDGQGHLRQAVEVFYGGGPTDGTLHHAVADLNGDHRIDVVQAQGETFTKRDLGAFEDKIYLGTNVPVDTARPVISMVESFASAEALRPLTIRARVHDNKSPTMPLDWQSVTLRWTDGQQTQSVPMTWYGEYLWRAELTPDEAGRLTYQICATDAAGNEACSGEVELVVK